MSEPNTELETVNVRLADGAATIELNRPETLNAWNAQLGEDLVAALAWAAGEDAVRSLIVTGAGRGFSSGADLRDVSGGDTTADGLPDVYRTLTERYHPIMRAIREIPKPVLARRERPRGRDRLLAGALLRPDRRRRERLLPARVRQHRPGPRRRLLAVRAQPRGHGARQRALDARRAPDRARRRSNGG